MLHSLEPPGDLDDYVDPDLHPEASCQVRWLAGGEARHPTVNIGSEFLVEPALGEMPWTLPHAGLR